MNVFIRAMVRIFSFGERWNVQLDKYITTCSTDSDDLFNSPALLSVIVMLAFLSLSLIFAWCLSAFGILLHLQWWILFRSVWNSSRLRPQRNKFHQLSEVNVNYEHDHPYKRFATFFYAGHVSPNVCEANRTVSFWNYPIICNFCSFNVLSAVNNIQISQND